MQILAYNPASYTPTAPSPLGAGIASFFMLIYFAIIVFYLVTYWKIFTKAGKPGWASIVPIYNAYIIIKIAGRPGWWLLLYLVPLVNFVIAIIVHVSSVKRRIVINHRYFTDSLTKL